MCGFRKQFYGGDSWKEVADVQLSFENHTQSHVVAGNGEVDYFSWGSA
jgi:hypothetical protein